MLIDIHTHAAFERHPLLRRPGGTRFPTPERLLEMMDGAGIDTAVVLSGASPECRYTIVTPEETLKIAETCPERLIPFCNIDPRYLTNNPDSDFSGILKAYKEMGCKGIGEYMPNLPFDDPLNMNVFKYAEQSGLPIIFHVAPRKGGCYGCIDEVGLPRLEKVLKAFPGLTFLGHSQPFWAEISRDVSDDERNSYPKGRVVPGRVVGLMRKYPNLHGDLSAVSGFNAISRDPEFGYEFMEEFSDRLYFGTDIANDPQKMPAVSYFKELKDRKRVSPDALENIMWKNAARLLGLGLSRA